MTKAVILVLTQYPKILGVTAQIVVREQGSSCRGDPCDRPGAEGKVSRGARADKRRAKSISSNCRGEPMCSPRGREREGSCIMPYALCTSISQ